jgi:hypothetical protein
MSSKKKKETAEKPDPKKKGATKKEFNEYLQRIIQVKPVHKGA